jgi:hypothetical protein
MARVVAVKEYLEKALRDESKLWTKMFILAEEKTGVDRLYVFVGELLRLLRSFPSFISISRLRCIYLDNRFCCQPDHSISQRFIIACPLRNNVTSFFRATPFHCPVNIFRVFWKICYLLLFVPFVAQVAYNGILKVFLDFDKVSSLSLCIFSINKKILSYIMLSLNYLPVYLFPFFFLFC